MSCVCGQVSKFLWYISMKQITCKFWQKWTFLLFANQFLSTCSKLLLCQFPAIFLVWGYSWLVIGQLGVRSSSLGATTYAYFYTQQQFHTFLTDSWANWAYFQPSVLDLEMIFSLEALVLSSGNGSWAAEIYLSISAAATYCWFLSHARLAMISFWGSENQARIGLDLFTLC